MNQQESVMLNDLVAKVQQTQLPEKDQEAEELLRRGFGANPDSLYILAQTVLVQNIALDQARAQIQQLQQQAQATQTQAQPAHTSFLGNLLGRHEPPPAPPIPPQTRPLPPPQYYPPAPSYPPDYAAAPPVAPQGGGSSFLRSAATTAAGVAAGALAFEGVESLLHGFGHSGGGGFGEPGLGGGFGGGGFGQRPEETIINNYYDDPNQGREGFEGRHEQDASYDDRNARLSDASYNPGNQGGNDNYGTDVLDDPNMDAGMDDSSSADDDSGSFDDGGGDDTI